MPTYLITIESNRCRIYVAAAIHANCFPGKNGSCFSFASDGDQVCCVLCFTNFQFVLLLRKTKLLFSMARSCDMMVAVLEQHTQFLRCYTDTLNVIFFYQKCFSFAMSNLTLTPLRCEKKMDSVKF